MNTKLIIIEGMDNTGKTTLIEMYKRIVSGLNPDIKVQVIHMEKPPQDAPESEISDTEYPNAKASVRYNFDKVNEFQHNAYMNLPKKLLEIKQSNDAPNVIILDRAWLSEYVYGYIYRNRNQHDIIIDNIIIEKQLMNIFGPENVFLVYLYPSKIRFIEKKEDGKSLAVLKAKELWTDKDNQKRFIEVKQKEELDRFNEAFTYMSIIKNKIPIQANKGDTNYFDNSMIVQMFDAIHN